MKSKIIAVMGFILLVANQLLLLKGEEFVQSQQPIDYVHWLLFIGAICSLSVNPLFSGKFFGDIASVLTSLGVLALLGQATIDFVWWSYGEDIDGMSHLVAQIMSEPSIRIPFVTLGPALFYLGVGLHALRRIRVNPIWALLTIIAIVITGLGSFYFVSRLVIVLGHVGLAIGMVPMILVQGDGRAKNAQQVKTN